MNRLSRVHEGYRRQTTDGRAIAYSEREREFTFAKNEWNRRLHTEHNEFDVDGMNGGAFPALVHSGVAELRIQHGQSDLVTVHCNAV